MPHPLVLASTSAYRRALLARLQLAFEVRDPEVDEAAQPGETPRELVLRLARLKALAIARELPAALVIGSDQVASLDGAALGKPGTAERACEQLRAASGREVEFLTAVTIAWDGGASMASDMDVTRVCFRPLSDAVIREYVERERPLDCAGAFKSEGLGITLFDAIHTQDPTALVGLPLIRLCTLLGRAGRPVLSGS